MLQIGKGAQRRSREAIACAAPQPDALSERARLLAYALLGLVVGAAGVMLAAPLVRAADDAGIRAFHIEEAARRGARQPAPASAYAPAGRTWSFPLFQGRSGERLPHPPAGSALPGRVEPSRTPVTAAAARHDTVSGASSSGRTICVRLCDGFHAPIGNLRSQADLAAHQTLCAAQNPGIPVKVFRVPAGASGIDGAVSADGKTYGSLPVAYGHEKAADPACRPAIPAIGERRVSLLRDFTLRPGDTVVLDGRAKTFTGSTNWPYRASDFSDFRSAAALSTAQRRLIDEKVGISQAERLALSLRQTLRVREAGRDNPVALAELRGPIDADAGASMRRILID